MKIIAILLIFMALYLYMILPRMFGRPDRSIFSTKLFAHRGLYDNRGDAPENSMAAFRKAVANHYGIELDVQMSKDHHPVIFHDFTLSRVCGVKGKVKDYTLDELRQFRLCGSRETIPTVEEFLQMVDGRVPLIVEYKVETTDLSVCRAVDPMLREYKGKYCIESFNPLVLLWYRRHHRNAVRGQLSDGFFFSRELKSRWQKILLLLIQFLICDVVSRPDFVAYNEKYKKNISRRLCRAFGGKAAAWTIKNQRQLESAAPDFDVFIFDSFIPEKGAG